MFLVGDVVWLWWADRRLRRVPRAGMWRALSAGFGLFMFVTVVWWLAARLRGLAGPPAALAALAMIWHLVILPVALGLLAVWGSGWIVGQILRWLASLGRRWERSAEGAEAPAGGDPGGLSRRQFIGASVAAIPPLMAVGSTGAGMYQLSTFRVRRLVVPVPSLPAELDGLTIAHVSDTHVGRFTNGRVLEKIAQATSTLNDGQPCDLVAFTGDLIDYTLEDIPAAVDMVRQMRSRYGVFLVEGNHDLFDGWERFDDAVLSAGLDLLLNQARTVTIRGKKVQIMGLVWGPPQRVPGRRYWVDDRVIGESLAQTLTQRDPEAFPILLAHYPHALDHGAQAGIPLTLAGHSHGGQLMLTPNVGPGPLMYRYWSGLYRLPNGCAGVVSNGVGNWFPLRINAPAELIHLTLTAAPS